MLSIYNSKKIPGRLFFNVLASHTCLARLICSVCLILLSLFFCISANAQSAPNITPTTGAYASQPNNGTQTVTIGGTITSGDQLTITVYDHGLPQAYEPVSYTVASSDTLTTIATNLTLAINNDTNLQAIHVSATSIGAIISITSTSSNITSYNSSINSGATETLTLPINVTITGDSGATFYYTTDGSTPTTSSPQYTTPFNITSTTTVKAIEELSGNTSPVTTSFIQIDASSAGLSKTGMQLWLKSDNNVTLNSGNVSAWGDISGNSNNATQSTSSSQPTVKTNAINNLPSLVFNGSSDYFTLPSGFSNFTAGATVFFICKPLANSNFQFFDFANGTDWNNRFDMWQYTNNGAEFEVFTSNTGTSLNGDSKLNGVQAAIVGNYSILEVAHDGVSTGNIYSNGVLQSTNIQMNPITNVTRTNNLIGKYSLGNNYINGEIAEIIIYNRQLSTSERQLAEKYLIQRYGMPLVPPVISPDSIINASGSQTVTMTTGIGNEIHYTTDGSTPTVNSPLYTGSFQVTTTTTVKAISVNGSNTSSVTTSSIMFDSSTANLPRNGLSLWLRSDSGVTVNSGNNVTMWQDSSNSGMDAISLIDTSTQPTLKANAINNLPGLAFNGSANYLNLPSGFNSLNQGATVFFICKPLANTNGQFFDFSNGSNYNNRFSMYQYTNNGVELDVYDPNGNNSPLDGSNAAPIGNYHVIEITHDGVNTANMYTNGSLQATNFQMKSITNSVRTTNFIGRYTQGNNYLNGEIAEVIIYNRQLSYSERKAAENYLFQRYAMPLVPPVISPDSIINASGSQNVTLTAELGNAIHYTTDGSTPTVNSPLYTGSFQVTTTTTVKAISVNGSNTSPVTTSSIIFDSSTANLPRNGLALWLRSDSGVSVNSTNNVILWADSSNNGMDASQPASQASPILQNTSSNGQPEIVFNGANSSLQLPTGFSDFTNGLTAFFVCKPVSGSSSVFFDFSCGVNWNNRIDMWQYTTNGAQFEVFDSSANDSQLSGATAATLGNYQLLQILHDGTNTATMYTNSVQQTQNTSMHPITNINRVANFIGQYSLGNSAFFNGKMSEVIFFNRALSATEIKNVQEYLAYRYAPNINPITGVYSGSSLNITTYSGDPIKYTLDGTTPNASSPQFTEPINITSSTTVNAVTSTSLGLSTQGTSYLNIDPAALAVPKTNLSLWLKPDYGVLTNGSNVTNWIDFSGLYNNATQTNSANQPQLLRNQINSFNSISFNGTSSSLQLPSGFANFTGGASGFVVLKPNAFSNFSSIFDLGNGVSGNGLSLTLAQPNGFGLTTQTGSNSTSINATTGAIASQYQLLEFTHNGASLATLFNNAAEITSSSSMNNIDNITRSSNFIGSDYTGNNLLNADIAELIVYNTGLSYTDKGAIEGYLLQKYQLSGVLPNGPVFSLSTGTLTSPASVMIQAPVDADAYTTSIYFTVDGSTPSTSSHLYTGPVAINFTTTLKAICVNNGVSSSVTSATYTLDSNKYPLPSSSDTTTPVINLQIPSLQMPKIGQ